MFRVTTIGDGYSYCQVEQENLMSYDGGPLPAPDADMGGLSGGPVLCVGDRAYPLIGVVTDSCHMDFGHFQVLKIASLDGIDENDLR
jgi:hypothetical protein